jgi:pyruvate dehydrogenase E2 component (dihydrolipoamide acetyltransferase)
MSTDVIMPQMGESIAEGTIVKWLKKVGDSIKRDEPIFEISTDKVDAEIPAPAAGVLTEIRVQEGETVPINTVVAIINGGGGGSSAPAAAETKPVEAKPVETQPKPTPQPQVKAEAPKPAPPKPAPPAPPTQQEPSGPSTKEELRRQRSSPLVRKIAQEHSVDLSNIEGTGLSGRVTKNDILSYIENGPVEPAKPAAQPVAETHATPVAYSQGERIEIVPMTPIRKRTSEHMIMSRRTSAHVTSVFEIDMTRIAKMRDRIKDKFQQANGTKLTFLPFIMSAVIDGIKAYPIMNSSVEGESIVYKKDINLGIAVALDWGLIVPVVKNADEKNLLGLARAVSDLADRARNKRLKPDEIQGGTFTITNPGVFGSLFGTPIINQPQVAILGVGAVIKRPVVIDDAIAIRSMVYFAISFDHRIIDGATADQFMAFVKEKLENYPELTV